MPLDPSFPTDPLAILDPAVRWYPGDQLIADMGRGMLIPPLVEQVRQGVSRWRAKGYAGASETTRALLSWWFQREHFLPSTEGWQAFAWRFAQREAVESTIWLYEVERARDPLSLFRYDSTRALSLSMFDEDWTRYVLKLATGAGKTKVMSLLIAWSYFHKLYEPDSTLSTNILLVAPNIIVLDRLLVDFEAARIFYSDPLLPPNGHEGRTWQDDFRLTVHVQDQLGHVAETGNLFLTNIHRVRQGDSAPSADDENLSDFFLGRKPVTKTTDSTVDLGVIVRTVPDLLVINDEAHHVRKETDWFRQIEDLHRGLQRKGSALSAQFDLTATPRHTNRAIFAQTISDYPLVEAIAQGVVKTPVLPDQASRDRLRIQQSDRYSERFQDHLDLGVREWRRSYQELEKAGKKSVLFVMTDNTANCDEVAEYLESRYPDLQGAVLVIHTNRSGEISESATPKNKAELELLRRQAREIDSWESRYKAVVSVMVLREGWDVQNVTSIVGLRPFGAPAAILPEQTLGRGLRRMFGGGVAEEQVSVVGTDAFLEFVEEIKNEGVELERVPMGQSAQPRGPMVIEVDRGNSEKDLESLEISLPKLKARIERGYDLSELATAELSPARLTLKMFSDTEQRKIVFRHINTGEVSHTTDMDVSGPGDWRNVVGWFTRSIMADLRLVGGFDVIFGNVKGYIENGLFDKIVDLDDSNVLRNLSEAAVTKAVFDTLKSAINRLTVRDAGGTRIQERIKFCDTRPAVVKRQPFFLSRKSIFNKVIGDNKFELAFARFLDRANDVQAFFKNTEATGFRIEYQSINGGIRNYYPDFVARDGDGAVWIIETKGREDVEDAGKLVRLKLWCSDATEQDAPRHYRALFVRQEDWDRLVNPLSSLGEATSIFES
jgi:type III restriction enzyme